METNGLLAPVIVEPGPGGYVLSDPKGTLAKVTDEGLKAAEEGGHTAFRTWAEAGRYRDAFNQLAD
jgi:hypothetical protein